MRNSHISNRPHLSREAQLCLAGLNKRVFDGTNYPSFSKIINDCITSSKYETIIICNDKARPTHQAVEKILTMLKEANIGYFESEEIDYIYLPTSWNYEKTSFAREQYFRKWKEDGNVITRQLAEEDYMYDLGPFRNTSFIEFDKSILMPYHGNIKEVIMQTNLVD